MRKDKYVLHCDGHGHQEILAGPVDKMEAERILKEAVEARLDEVGKSRDAELSSSPYGTVISYADGGFPGGKEKERFQVTTYSTDVWMPYAHSYRKLILDMPAVIFLDGKKVTRDHGSYDFTKPYSVPYCLAECAYAITAGLGLDADIYAAMDEVSFFFLSPSQLLETLDTDDHAEYVLTLFVKEVERKVQEVYPEMVLKGQIFNIRGEDRDIYFSEREAFCRKTAAMYVAKKYLEKKEYTGKDPEEVLKAHGLYEGLVSNAQLYEGIHRQYRKETALDVMAGMLGEATKCPFRRCD